MRPTATRRSEALGDGRVTTTSGDVRGVRVRDVDTFLGIPYAAPPIGPRRFLRPSPPARWAGVRDCVEYGPVPMQNQVGPADVLLGIDGRPQDEDCLTVNVWTPACDDRRRPVILWLHGGGFAAGGSAGPRFDGTNLAGNDVVVVTCNYRVGALGFLHLGWADDAYADAGNAGLLDQVAALEWVGENIAAFGGDPDRVTVLGQSAGGVSVACLLAMPTARDLFRRAVIQSGGAHAVHAPGEAEEVARLVLDALEIAPDRLADLADVPAAAVLRAQRDVATDFWTKQLAWPMAPFLRLPLQPVADGVHLPSSVLDGIATGPSDVDLLIGSNLDEVNFPALLGEPNELSEDELVERACVVFGTESQGRRAVDAYRRERPGASPRELLFAMDSDQYFRTQATRIADVHPGDVYMYLFTLRGSRMGTRLGAAHGLEIPFVFDNLDAPGVDVLLGAVTPEGRRLAKTMSAAWAAFARHGRPAAPDVPPWPRYDTSTRRVMEWGAPPRVLDDPGAAQRSLWATPCGATAPALGSDP